MKDYAQASAPSQPAAGSLTRALSSSRLGTWSERLLLFASLILVAHAAFYFVALGYDAVDDAYISFVYARNAILGNGLVFNPGERVEGFTNFLWTGMMIPVVGGGLDVGRVSIVLGVLFALGTLWLTTRLARAAQLPRAAGWLAALCLAVDGSFAIWAVSGLETAMFAFLITLGATLYLLEQRHASWVPSSGVVFALAAMTRPEAGAVFALTVGHQLVGRVLRERRLFTYTDIARGVAFTALFAPYWLLRWRYYHSFFPNSFYAKVAPGGPLAQIERGWHYVTQFVDVHLGWLILVPAVIALIVAAARALQARRSIAGPSVGKPDQSGLNRNESASADFNGLRRRISTEGSSFGTFAGLFALSYFALLVIAYGAYIVYVGGDWSVGRFFVPILPMAYLLIAAGLVEIYRGIADGAAKLSFRAERSRVEKSLERAGEIFPMAQPSGCATRFARNDTGRVFGYVGAGAAGLLLLALAFASSWNGEYGIFIRGFDAARATEARETMGRWLQANVPRGTLIAVDAAGQVPYFSGLPTIDMFGINDLHIGRLNVPTLGQGTPGHEKFDLAYVIQRAPRYVIIYGTLFDSVTQYRRANVEWTRDENLKKFLTIYERK
jgi:arabinofuranosyltransferase